MSIKLYDAEIEYLESSGTQYINTGVLGSLITRFKIKAICYEAGNDQNTQLLGGTESGASTFFGARKNSKLTPANWYCRDANKVSLGDPHSPSIIDATINSSSSQTGTLEIETTITNFYSFSDSWGFPNEKLLIFGGHYSRKSPLARCYYLQLFTNNILIMDMIPVRIGNVGYMYDKVSGQFFGNTGTGSFVLGPDVAPAAYANEIAFLESTGSQYIDTGITANGEFDFDFKLRIDSWSTNSVYAGARSSSQFLTICQCQDGQHFVFAYLNNVFTSQQTFPIGKDYVIQASFKDGSQIASANNVEILNESYTGTEALNMPIYLFKRSFYDSSDSVAGLFGKIYYFKIWQNDTLVRDYIPVEYNNIGYLYDKVSGEFFANQGTGKFVLGHRAPRFDGKACARSYTRRQLMMEIGRPYDAKIEYLETQGNCYIITDCVPSGSNIAIASKFMYIGYVKNTSWTPWYISYTNEQTQVFRIARAYSSDTTIMINNGATGDGSLFDAQFTVSANGIYEIVTNGRTVTFNGVTKTNRVASSSLNTASMRIMHVNFKGRCYYFKLRDGNTLLLDCIPVRVGNVGYMYDKVSGKLFGNAGTGNLILGPDK